MMKVICGIAIVQLDRRRDDEIRAAVRCCFFILSVGTCSAFSRWTTHRSSSLQQSIHVDIDPNFAGFGCRISPVAL